MARLTKLVNPRPDRAGAQLTPPSVLLKTPDPKTPRYIIEGSWGSITWKRMKGKLASRFQLAPLSVLKRMLLLVRPKTRDGVFGSIATPLKPESTRSPFQCAPPSALRKTVPVVKPASASGNGKLRTPEEPVK